VAPAAREATRRRVLDATVRTLAAQGFTGTTARSIATTGGFAAGVIYYHFTDLDELFAATVRHVSETQLEQYRADTEGVDSAVELVERLRALYTAAGADRYVAAVQELFAAAHASTGLAEEVRAATTRWQDYAEATIRRLVEGTPFADLVPVREAAVTAVAAFLGVEMLTHLDPGLVDPAGLFDAAARAAALLDATRLL